MRPEKKHLKLGDLAVTYWEMGQGAPLIILHGWGLSGQKYAPLIKQLAKGRRVLALDLPGFGGSTLPPLTWGLPQYGQFMLGFVRALKIKDYSLLGHSFGGRVSMEMAARRPPGLRKMILTGVPLTRMPGGFRLVFWLGAKLGKKLSSVFPFSLAAYQGRKWLYRLARANDYVKETSGRKVIFKRVISQSQRHLLAKIRVPTLLVWGEHDRLTPLTNARQLKRGIAGAKLVVVARANHRLPYQKPVEFGRLVKEFCQ